MLKRGYPKPRIWIPPLKLKNGKTLVEKEKRSQGHPGSLASRTLTLNWDAKCRSSPLQGLGGTNRQVSNYPAGFKLPWERVPVGLATIA